MSGIESEDGKEKQSAKTSIAGPQEEEYGEQIPCSRVKYFLDGLTSVRCMAESDLVDTKRNCLTKFVNSSLLPAETFYNILSLLDHSSNCFLCANDKALWYSAVGLEIQAALNSIRKGSLRYVQPQILDLGVFPASSCPFVSCPVPLSPIARVPPLEMLCGRVPECSHLYPDPEVKNGE
jgi:hypothetical protein